MDTPMIQTAPWPTLLEEAVKELKYVPGWIINLSNEDRGQGCSGLTLNIYPNKPDAYHPDQHVRTRFLYPVPAAAFNRESWEEWLWARIEETEDHERAEWFRFIDSDGNERRPFKPIHQDGWDPGVVRSVVDGVNANIPNEGRLVLFPCASCDHLHGGIMGEHNTIELDRGCTSQGCVCGL